MSTVRERVQAAWSSSDPLALDHAVEAMAAGGVPEGEIMDALKQLLFQLRAADADDATEERVLQVMDRLVGWCLPQNRIQTKQTSADIEGPSLASGPAR